jgi:hypothetical protein
MDHSEWTKQQRQQQVEKLWPEYRALLTRDATGDKPLSTKDHQRLDELIGAMGFTGADFVMHRNCVRKAAEHTAASAGLDADEKRLAELVAEQKAKDGPAFLAIQENERGIKGRAQAVAQLNGTMVTKRRAATDRANLLGETFGGALGWRILGEADPAVNARKRRIIQRLYTGGLADGDGITTRYLEDLMMQVADNLAAEFNPNSGFEWVEAPQQTAAEKQALLALARELIASGKLGRYLLADEGGAAVKSGGNVATSPAALAQLSADNHRVEVGRYFWIPAPGQDAAEFDRLLTREQKKAEKERPHAPKVQMHRSNPWLHPEPAMA